MNRWKVALSVAVLAAAIPTVARADKVGIRPEFEVSQNRGYGYAYNEGRSCLSISASGDGTFVVAWDDFYNYDPWGTGYPSVWARRLDKLGRPLGPEFQVSGLASYASWRGLSVASDSAGRFVVVWGDDNARAYGHGTWTGVLARRFNASGAALGGPFLVGTDTTDIQYWPKVGMDGNGNFMVVWGEGGGWPDDWVIGGRRYDSLGVPVGDEFQVNTDTSCCPVYGPDEGASRNLGVAGDAAGNFMVVWSGQGDNYDDVMARVFDSTGAATGPQFLVNTYTTGYQWVPSVTADSDGRFIVIWSGVGYSDGIYAQRFDSTGAPIGGEFQITDSPVAYPHISRIAADPDGGFVVVWDEEYYDDYGSSIRGREFDSTGAPMGAEFRVDQPGDYSDPFRFSAIAGSAAGDFVVVWSQYDYYVNSTVVVGRLLSEAPVACTSVPKTGCREQTIERRGVFRFKKATPARRNVLVWRWVRGQAASVEDLGDPFTTDSYAFCVYDASADPQPLISTAVPAGGACGKGPCWKELSGKRLDYLDRVRYVGGLELIRMKPGEEGKARALVRGRKENLGLPDTPLTPPVTVQLQVANGECWTAEYGEFIKKNADGVFSANPGGTFTTTIPPTTTTTTTSVPVTTTTIPSSPSFAFTWAVSGDLGG